MKLATTPRRKARIEIIPLIDVVFFLLATFVMVSLSMVKNRGVPVHLPIAATGLPQARDNSAVLTIKPSGEMFFDKARVSTTELPARLAAFKTTCAEPRIFIQADESVAWGRAISVLDEVRRSGISRVAIETKNPPLQP